MDNDSKVTEIIKEFPHLANKVNELYTLFTQRYGKDESIRTIIEGIVAKAHRAKKQSLVNKLGDNK